MSKGYEDTPPTIAELAAARLSEFGELKQIMEPVRERTKNDITVPGCKIVSELYGLESWGVLFDEWCKENYAIEKYSGTSPWKEKIMLGPVLKKYSTENTENNGFWEDKIKAIKRHLGGDPQWEVTMGKPSIRSAIEVLDRILVAMKFV